MSLIRLYLYNPQDKVVPDSLLVLGFLSHWHFSGVFISETSLTNRKAEEFFSLIDYALKL